jgi:hypothetical protein
MASPICCGFELGNAHSRFGIGGALGRVFEPAFNIAARKQSESLVEREVGPRKANGVHNGNNNGHFAVRGRRGRAVGSHSLGLVRWANGDDFKEPRLKCPIGAEFPVVLGSPNKSFKRTPNTPQPAANAFGIFSQHSAPRSAPFH